MTFDEFKDCYAETMMHYQCIEHDIKLIYAYMLEGNAEKNLDGIENKTLGTMIRMLEKLDYSDNKPNISKGDYEFLMRICDKRNYWAHQAFIDFLYIDNPILSKEYKNICNAIKEDCEETNKASSILENLRIELCNKYKRNS